MVRHLYYNNICKFYSTLRYKRSLKLVQNTNLFNKYLRIKHVSNSLRRVNVGYRKVFYGLYFFYVRFLSHFASALGRGFLFGQPLIVGGGKVLLEQLVSFRARLLKLGLSSCIMTRKSYSYLEYLKYRLFSPVCRFVNGGYTLLIYGESELALFLLCYTSVAVKTLQYPEYRKIAISTVDYNIIEVDFLNYFSTVFNTSYYYSNSSGFGPVDFVWVCGISAKYHLFSTFNSIIAKLQTSAAKPSGNGLIIVNQLFLNLLFYPQYLAFYCKISLFLGHYKRRLI